jgi:shikimate kinase
MMKNKILYICGFMGSGKTTEGTRIAEEIGFDFIDLDDYIVNKYNQSIVNLFKNLGEEEFRNIETNALKECTQNHSKILIATGGGTPCFNNNLEFMKSNGSLIYLKLSEQELLIRLSKAKINRPLIKDKNNEELLLYIKSLLKTREFFYNQADIIIDENTMYADLTKNIILNLTSKSH